MLSLGLLLLLLCVAQVKASEGIIKMAQRVDFECRKYGVSFKNTEDVIFGTTYSVAKSTFGQVRVVLSRDKQEYFALKEFNGSEFKKGNLAGYYSILTEIQVARRYKHANIQRLIGCIPGKTSIDPPTLVYPFVKDGDIPSVIQKNNGRLKSEHIVHISKGVLNALDYLRHHRVIHGNIRGANILVDANGVVTIADFGVATWEIDQQNCLKSKLGAESCYAPEVDRQEGRCTTLYDHKIDIWSFGLLMVELIIGRTPQCPLSAIRSKPNIDVAGIIETMIGGDASRESSQWKAANTGLKDLAMSCLHVNPNDRLDVTQLLWNLSQISVANAGDA